LEKRVLIAIKWPVLSVDSLLGDVRRLQRAHLVLAWLVQFFVHSVSKGSDESGTLVPRTLAIPLVRVSNALGIAPVLTYADTVLWNWERIRPEEPTSIDNIRYTNLFSGTDDESNFFMALARVELRGTEIPGIIDDCIYAASEGEVNCIWKTADRLARLADIIADLSEAIESVRSTCDPHVFFWAIRPWFEGSGGSYGGLGQRWIYEGVEDSDDLDLSGPSGGQSSAIHALDLFLDVDHKSRRDSCAAAATGREAEKNAECGFMERMRRYMPGSHREYLSQVRSVRALAQREPMLQEGYDSAVMALKKLRDVHMRIACLYIVRMAKTKPSGRGGCPVSHTMEKMQKARGTGGSELCTLLEAGRAATKRTLLGPKWGQRYEDVH
jgi:indoleamine 2,3-dioxygenase